MGIKDLNKTLSSVNAVINKKYNQNLLKRFYPMFCNNTEGISGFVCHIDLSLILYKFLYSYDNMEDVYKNIKRRILELKNNNNIVLLYLEPLKNKRKEETQKERKECQLKVKTNLKNDIQREIDLFNEFKSDDIEINQSLLEAIGFNEDNKKISFEEYNKNIDIINIESEIYVKKTYHEAEAAVFDHGFSSVDLDESNLDFLKTSDGEAEKVEYNVIKDKKQLFQYFLYQNSINNHSKYIINRLLNEEIISNNDLIKSIYFDAEINIIHEIKEKYSTKKNLVISVDQDCILFALLHHKTKYIYLKNSINMGPDDLTIIKNNFLTKNIAILTAFFNKTDYFKGVRNCGITEKRLDRFLTATEIFKYQLNLKEIVSSYLDWFIHDTKVNITESEESLTFVQEYFINFQLYLSLDPVFYITNKKYKRLEISEVHNYFINDEFMLPYLDETEIKYKQYI